MEKFDIDVRSYGLTALACFEITAKALINRGILNKQELVDAINEAAKTNEDACKHDAKSLNKDVAELLRRRARDLQTL